MINPDLIPDLMYQKNRLGLMWARQEPIKTYEEFLLVSRAWLENSKRDNELTFRWWWEWER